MNIFRVFLKAERAFSLQFHPEAHGGPLDCGGMFARFVAMMEGKADA